MDNVQNYPGSHLARGAGERSAKERREGRRNHIKRVLAKHLAAYRAATGASWDSIAEPIGLSREHLARQLDESNSSAPSAYDLPYFCSLCPGLREELFETAPAKVSGAAVLELASDLIQSAGDAAGEAARTLVGGLLPEAIAMTTKKINHTRRALNSLEASMAAAAEPAVVQLRSTR